MICSSSRSFTSLFLAMDAPLLPLPTLAVSWNGISIRHCATLIPTQYKLHTNTPETIFGSRRFFDTHSSSWTLHPFPPRRSLPAGPLLPSDNAQYICIIPIQCPGNKTPHFVRYAPPPPLALLQTILVESETQVGRCERVALGNERSVMTDRLTTPYLMYPLCMALCAVRFVNRTSQPPLRPSPPLPLSPPPSHPARHTSVPSEHLRNPTPLVLCLSIDVTF